MPPEEEYPELAGPLRRLACGFPDVPHDVVASILTDAYILTVNVTGEPLVDRAEELAQVRLEVRTRHPIGWVI
ncbi:MAG TPA: hypothetical protein VHE57_08785 [Mycobacteriales bacterium]|nr:hypothetical protein [Mycobacteriales bacterium]